MSYSPFTSKDYEVISREYAELKEAARRRCPSSEELEVIQQAFEFASAAHKNVRRRSGEPYIIHPIAVAKIVVTEIGLGYKSISAALLHDVVEDTDYTVEDIERLFGKKIASLVDGLTKIKTVLDDRRRMGLPDGDEAPGGESEDREEERSLQAENFKRILLTLGDDVRVVLIKLADRLHNCRTIEYMPEYKRDKILSETMFIFVPLAHRLGLYGIKSEMENIWLRYKEPEAYNTITGLINRDSTDKEREIDSFIRPIEDALSASGFSFHIKKRVKTPYSIWKKMNTKGVSFEQVYDLYAVRIIFSPPPGSKESERDQCYHIFSIITGIYAYKSDRMRDWVKHPKSNGYEALHCTLVNDKGMWVEVQIRSRRMDDIAEKGIAAHWAYKKDGYISSSDGAVDQWLEKVKEILVNPDVSALDLLDLIHEDLTSSHIVVFTPKGDQRSVEKGSTALDFAFQIHSDIGRTAIAAKVNLKLVSLSYELRSGDTVEIITAQSQTPKKEWLQFVRTRHAKSLIMDYFRSMRPEVIAFGRSQLEEKLSQMNVPLSEDLMRELTAVLSINSPNEILFRYGLGLISFERIASAVDLDRYRPRPSSIIDYIKGFGRRDFQKSRDNAEPSEGSAPARVKVPQATPPPASLGENFDRTAFHMDSPADPYRYAMAPCCNPIAGESVVGFFAPDGSITVHRKSCSVAERISTKHGDWIVLPRWSSQSSLQREYPVRITMRGIDRVGLLSDITKYISLVMGMNIKHLTLDTSGGIFQGHIDLQVKDKEVLGSLLEQLRHVDGISELERIDLPGKTDDDGGRDGGASPALVQ